MRAWWWMSLCFIGCVLGCEPAYHVDLSVELSDQDRGEPLVVLAIEGQPWNGTDGLPEPLASGRPLILLATVVDRVRFELVRDDLFCPRSLFLAAWIDSDGSAGIEERLDGRAFTIDSYGDDDLRTVLDEIAQQLPEAGDSRAVAGPLDFDHHPGGACDPDTTEIELVPERL